MMHICISKLSTIGSVNGLLPAGARPLFEPMLGYWQLNLGINFNEILIKICTFSFKKMHLKMLSGKWWPFCLCLSVLIDQERPFASCMFSTYISLKLFDESAHKIITSSCQFIVNCHLQAQNLWRHKKWDTLSWLELIVLKSATV